MNEIIKLRKLYDLKNVYRANSIGKRKESSAEHSWSSLLLADFLLSGCDEEIDKLRVFELLLYHDIIEVESGDIPIHHVEARKNKKEKEKAALEELKKYVPEKIKDRYLELFDEYEKKETKEAKFAKAVDKIDAVLHEIDYKEDWKGWTEEMVREFHGKATAEFEVTKDFFEKLVSYAKENGFFDQ